MSLRRSLKNLGTKEIVTSEEQVKYSMYAGTHTFDYELNDKAAKSKLLKGAKRDTFRVEENSLLPP